MHRKLNLPLLEQALRLLSSKLDLRNTVPINLVICGGSALVAMGLRERTTHDLDVVALINADHQLISPDPLPDFVINAASEVARDLGLMENWLNNEPSSGEGGLFQLGLPKGFADRLTKEVVGPRLSVHFISRLDQIHFKLYATVDQKHGAHLSDLLALKPNAEEIQSAARWAMTHDVSDGFKFVMKEMLQSLGYETVANKL